MKYLDSIPEKEMEDLNVPTGYPLIYELDPQTLKVPTQRQIADGEK
jgi:bisphosphoglycerate-dependent phosphoglycerate mutase